MVVLRPVDRLMMPVEVEVDSEFTPVDSEPIPLEVEVERLVTLLLVVLRPVDKLVKPVDVDMDSELTPVDSELMPVDVELDRLVTLLLAVLKPVDSETTPLCAVLIPVDVDSAVKLLLVVLKPVDSEVTLRFVVFNCVPFTASVLVADTVPWASPVILLLFICTTPSMEIPAPPTSSSKPLAYPDTRAVEAENPAAPAFVPALLSVKTGLAEVQLRIAPAVQPEPHDAPVVPPELHSCSHYPQLVPRATFPSHR